MIVTGVEIGVSAFVLGCFAAVTVALARAWKVSAVPSLAASVLLAVVGGIFFVPGSPFFLPSDALYYQGWAADLSSGWSGRETSRTDTIWPGKGVWPAIIAVFYFFFGPVTLPLICLNASIVGLSITIIQRTVLLLSGRDYPQWVAILGLSSPPVVLFGAAPLRESIWWLGASLGSLAIASLERRKFVLSAGALVFSAFLMVAIRPDAGVVVAYSFAVALAARLWLLPSTRRSFSPKTLSAVSLMLLALTIFPAIDAVRPGTSAESVVVAAEALGRPDVNSSFQAPPQHVQGTENSQIQRACEQNVASQVVCNALKHLPNALFGPFHWEYQPTLIWVLSGASTLHFLAISLLALLYFRRGARFRLAGLGIVFVSSVALIMFASVLTNYGILIRFRATVELLLLPLAAPSLARALEEGLGKKVP